MLADFLGKKNLPSYFDGELPIDDIEGTVLYDLLEKATDKITGRTKI